MASRALAELAGGIRQCVWLTSGLRALAHLWRTRAQLTFAHLPDRPTYAQPTILHVQRPCLALGVCTRLDVRAENGEPAVISRTMGIGTLSPRCTSVRSAYVCGVAA